jgi:hypothetical protein
MIRILLFLLLELLPQFLYCRFNSDLFLLHGDIGYIIFGRRGFGAALGILRYGKDNALGDAG